MIFAMPPRPFLAPFRPLRRPRATPALVGVALLVLGACEQPLDYDLRGGFGGFSTANAAANATTARPRPDARGVISYPTYQVAVVRRGETASDVAGRLGVNGDQLASYNGVGPDVTLRAGEVLALPDKIDAGGGNVDIASLAGAAIDASPDTTPVTTAPLKPVPVQPGPEPVRHKVARGETAYTISRLYQVPVKSLAEWNGLGPDFALREGQVLLIPIASQRPPRGAGAPTATVASTSAGAATGTTTETTAVAAAPATTSQPGEGTPTPTPPSATTPLPTEPVAPAAVTAAETAAVVNPIGAPSQPSSAAMAFPVKGNIIRAYAKGKTDGIDIAAAPGTAVTAAADGTVAAITSDADQIPIIVVRHPDNLLTVYANVDKITVKKGDKIKRGQKLAVLRPGDDAYVHFEVREGFDSVDPLPYLE